MPNRLLTHTLTISLLAIAMLTVGWSTLLTTHNRQGEAFEQTRELRTYFSAVNGYLIGGAPDQQIGQGAPAAAPGELVSAGVAEMLALAAIRCSYPDQRFFVESTGQVGDETVAYLQATGWMRRLPAWIAPVASDGSGRAMATGPSILNAASRDVSFLNLHPGRDDLALFRSMDLVIVHVTLSNDAPAVRYVALSAPGIYTLLSGEAEMQGDHVTEVISPDARRMGIFGTNERVSLSAADSLVVGGGRAVLSIASGATLDLIAAVGVREVPREGAQATTSLKSARTQAGRVRDVDVPALFPQGEIELLAETDRSGSEGARSWTGGWLLVPPEAIASLTTESGAELVTIPAINGQGAQVAEYPDQMLIANRGDGALLMFVIRVERSADQ
ncbi:MAG: hypothetical protein KF883_14080 [Thermomicrobiales bacterium]|nr:hypothetical protein [Thermomicrobiales bacterium]